MFETWLPFIDIKNNKTKYLISLFKLKMKLKLDFFFGINNKFGIPERFNTDI